MPRKNGRSISQRSKSPRRRIHKFHLEPLDPRILLDASGLLAPGQISGEPFRIEPAMEVPGFDLNSLSSTLGGFSTRHEIVFVDAGAESQELLNDLARNRPGTQLEVVLLDGDSDGLQQISRSLRGRMSVDAIHIVSHGEQGRLQLGNAAVSTGQLSTAYRRELSTIGASLAVGGDILIYGCDLASDEAGQQFVQQFSRLTSADVAASDDITGTASLGGDWQLEFSSGPIETEIVVSAAGQTGLWLQLSGVPTATLNLPTEQMINENFSFSVTFSNTSGNGADVGYTPFVDLSVPDGFVPAAASFLGSTIPMSFAGVFDGGGNLVDAMTMNPVDHPVLGTPVTGGTTGETLYVVELPFGSFTPGQPAATVDIVAALDRSAGAVVGTPLAVDATGGFALGCDPLDNPGTDAPILGVTDPATITPTVINLTKTSDAPEDERSTGPNFPFTYTLTIDIADTETVTALDIVDALPGSFVYVAGSVTVTTAAGVAVTGQSITDEPVAGAPQNSPDNNFLIEFSSATGTTADNDIEISYTVWIDQDDADSNPVLNAVSGDDVAVTNDASVTGNYITGMVGDDDAATDYLLTQKSIAIQKGVAIVNDTGAVGATPGDTLEYTMNLQVSDFFEFSSVVLDDNFSDGQAFNSSFVPTYSINEAGINTSGTFAPANYSVTLNSPGDGSTDVHFDLFSEDPDGVLTGDLFADASQDGGTTVTVRFQTIIQEDFLETYPTGDQSVDVGDILRNDVVATGTLPSGQTERDTSATSLSITGPSIQKSNYAIDGNTAMANGMVEAGHTLTYRIQFDMATADIEKLVITDFIPLPVFLATEITTFDNSAPSAVAPPAGTVKYGPAHTLHTVIPATDPPSLSTDMDANSVSINFDDFDVTPSVAATIDLLLTVTAQDVLFADGLFLTNQANASYGTTNAGNVISTAITMTQLAAPDLQLTKGIVSSTALAPTFTPATVGPAMFAAPGVSPSFGGGIDSTTLAADPIDSDLADADAGDLVRFAIAVENIGNGDGYDVLLQDALPPEYVIPGGGLNLEVRDGDGTSLTYTGAAADLFTTGIRIDDPGGGEGGIQGLDDAQMAGDGSNIIVVTYDLELAVAVQPDQVYTNTALIGEYSQVDAGNDITAGSSSSKWTDDATVETLAPVGTKSLVVTSEGHTSGADVAVGEIVRYRLVAEIPEGTMTNLQFDDNLPSGLTFLDDGTSMVAFVSNGLGISSNDISGSLNLGLGTGPGVSGAAPVAPAFLLPDDNVGSSTATGSDPDTYNNGTDPQFKFGEVINADSDADSEYIVVEFNAIVTNRVGVDNGDSLRNNFDIRINGVAEDRSNNTVVTVREPQISNLTKTVTPTTGDAGDAVSFTVTFSNTGPTDAFNLQLTDALPSEYALALGTVVATPGPGVLGIANGSAGNTVSFTIDQIPASGSVSIVYDASLLVDVEPSEILQNTVGIRYTSLPGANGSTGNATGSDTPGTSGAATGERDGSGGHNDYADTSTANVTVNSPTISKTLVSTSIVNTTNANDEAVIGETVQYQVVVTLPEGTTNVAQVVDTLDPGLTFVSLDSIVTSAAITSANVAIDLNNAATIPTGTLGQTVSFDFGDLTNSNNSNAAVETITLRYTAVLTNVVTSQGEGVGTMLNNSAVFAWEVNGNPTQTAANSAQNIEVIEPALELTKNVSVPSADAGDSVTYTIVVQHASGSDTDAFDVTFSDPVPTGINYTFATDVTVTHSVTGDIKPLFEQSGQTLQTISGTSFDLLDGEMVTITIIGAIGGGVTPGLMLTNTATTDWTSLPGVDTNERDGADGTGGPLDDYEASSTAIATAVTAPLLAKTLVSTSINNANNAADEVVIGETAQYQLIVTIPEATIPNSDIVDDLDLGLEFISLDSIASFSGGIASTDLTSSVDLFTNTAAFNPAITGDGLVTPQQLTFDLGDLVNVNRTNTADEILVLTYTVRTTNIAANSSNGAAVGTLLDNRAVFRWDAGTPMSTAPADAADLEVIEPELALMKVIDDDTPRLGQTVTYTLTIDHSPNSDAEAHDIVVADALPLGMTLNLASLNVVGAAVVADTSAGNNIDLELDQLALGGTITITYDASVTSNTADIGLMLNNTATSNWTSLPGFDSAERDGSDGSGGAVNDYATSGSESATVTQPVLNVAKEHVSFAPNLVNSDNVDLAIRVVMKNDGNLDLSNLSLVEDVMSHFGSIFIGVTPPAAVDASGLTMGGSAPNLNGGWDGNLAGGGQTNLFDGASGTLRPGEWVAVDFVVTIDPDAVGASYPLENQVEGTADFTDDLATQSIMDLSDDGTDPSSANPGAPGDTGGMDDPNPLQVPDISLAKAVLGTPTQLPNGNWSVNYELVVANSGTVDLRNLQFTEDLEIEFGAGVFVGVTTLPSIQVGPANPGSTAPIFSGTWDGGLGGSGNTTMFNGTSGHLEPGDGFSVRFTVEVNPDGTGTSSQLTNQVEALGDGYDEGGLPISGGSVMDASDDGANPNSTNAGSPGDLGTSNDPTPLEIPEIGVAKQVNSVTATGIVGEFDVIYTVVVENTGSVDLQNIQIVEQMAAEFGAGFVGVQSPVMITGSSLSAGAVPPTLASAPVWNGTAGAANFFDGTSGLFHPGDSVTLQFTIRIDATAGDTTAPTDWTNQVTATADGITSSGLVPTSDLSDDGTDPNTNNGFGTSDDPTGLFTPQIRAGKNYGTIVTNMDGTYSVPVVISVVNTGVADLTNLSLTEDIQTEFGNAFVSLSNPQITAVGPYGGVLPNINPAWGAPNTLVNVIDPGQANESLLIGEQFEFTFDVIVDPDAVDDQSQYMMNQAMVSGIGTGFDGMPVTVMDVSGSPGITDPSGNDLDNPAVLLIPEVRTTKVVTGIAPNGPNWNVTFDIALENTGSTDLAGIDLLDDLNAQFGSQFVGVVAVSIDDTTGIGTGTPPTLNFGASAGASPFDGGDSGAGSDNLLNNDGLLTPGEYITVTLTITVDPDATGGSVGIVNQATGFGDDTNSGLEVSDPSDDGTNPNSTNPASPVDTGGHDDPTPVDLPDLAVTKQVLGVPAVQPNGNFLVTYQLVMENTGTVNLDNLQITEDISGHFGAGILVSVTSSPTITSGPGNVASSVPTSVTWDGGLAGNTNMFDGASGLLVPGDSFVVEFTIEIDPDASGFAGVFLNQVLAAGDDPLGNTFTDDSDDGTDPNTSNPGAAGDMGTFDDPTPLVTPGVNAAKEVIGVPLQVSPGSDQYDVAYRVVLQNTGNVTLDGLDLFDDLASRYGAALVSASSPAIVAHTLGNPANLPTINPAWSSDTSQSMFNDDGLMAVGETITVRFDLVLDATVAGGATLLNQVNFVADDPASGAESGPSDLSDDGSDPTGQNSGSPGDMGTFDDLTPLLLPDATIGLAKGVTNVTVPTATIAFTMENLGNVTAHAVALTDELDSVFGAGNYNVDSIAVTTAPTDAASNIVVNAGFNGSLDQLLLDNSVNNTLAVGDTAVVSIDVSITNFVDIDGPGPMQLGEYVNTAFVTSRDVNGNTYQDDSTDGADADPNGDGDPGESAPTPIYVPTIATIGVAKESIWNDASDTAVFNFRLEHLGTIGALNITMQENLDAVFGAGNYSVSTPTLISGPATLAVNTAFNGSSDTELIAASSTMQPGETAQIQIDITVHRIADPQLNGLGFYENQVTLMSENVIGQMYSDTSTDGTDPDPDGDGDPNNDSVPTNGVLTPNAVVGIAKSGSLPMDSSSAVFLFTFENFGNTRSNEHCGQRRLGRDLRPRDL